MKYLYTPQLVLKKRQNVILAGFLLSVFVMCLTAWFLATKTLYATQTTLWNSTNISAGTTATTTSNGTVRLAITETVGDASNDAFIFGDFASDSSAMSALSEGQGVEINQGYAYTTDSTPELEHSAVNHSFLNDELLYISTGDGLSIINTQGTVDPGDDTLVTRYHTGSTLLYLEAS